MEEFLQFAAELFDVERQNISMDTGYGEIPAWDSMMQIRLVAEIEDKYGAIIPMEEVESCKTLADFYRYVR